MAGVVSPFLALSDFQGMFPRTLKASETALAELLLDSAAATIRKAIEDAGKDPLAADDPNAKLVSFLLVSEALAVPADLSGHSQYLRQSDDRISSGTLLAGGPLLDFTDHHRRLLGLTGTVLPEYYFDGYPEPTPGVRYVNSPAGPQFVGEVVIGEAP